MRYSSGWQLTRMVFVYLFLLLLSLAAIYPLNPLVVSTQSSIEPATSFLTWLGQSALVAFAVTLPGAALACVIGYSWSRARFLRRGSRFGRTLFAQLLLVVILLAPISCVLIWLGLIRPWCALLIIYLVTTLPFCSWQMKRTFDTIPIALEESAEIEGASPSQSFFRVILPLAMPATAITLLFSLFVAWNEYVLAAAGLRNRAIFALPGEGRSFELQALTEPRFFLAPLLVAIPAALLFLLLSWFLISLSRERSVEE